MPLELIPNQPYIFEQVLPEQSCLNNDPNEYSQLVQPGDQICIQQIITPCTEDVLCDANMYEEGVDLLQNWDTADGWTTTDPNHIAFDGATSGAGNLCEQTWGTLLEGRVYRLEYTITSITGDAGVIPSLGVWSGDEASALGTYVEFYVCTDPNAILEFVFTNAAPTGADTIEITVTSFQQWVNDCWVDEQAFNFPSWTYSFDETTLQGKYCANDIQNGDLVNTSAYVTNGNYHRVKFTITDMTAGGLEVILGGDYLGAATENGEYSFYGVPTAGGDLIFRKSPTFDGCISYVEVDDYGLVDPAQLADSNYQLTVVNDSLLQESDIIEFEVWDDRIIWCFNTTILTGELSPIEMDCNDVYRFKIVSSSPCGDSTMLSTNTFRWNTSWDCTFVVNGYSDGYAFGFYFGSTTAPVFYLTQRLRVLQFAPRYPATAEEYLYSNGSFARSFAQSGKIRSCWFDYVDENCHDVIRLQLLSDVLTLDSDVYFAPVKDYEPEWDEHRYNLAQSRVDLVKEETLFNRSCDVIGQAPCTTNTTTTPPSSIIGYRAIGSFDLSSVNPANFQMEFMRQGDYGTVSNNDATTIGGRNSILANMSSYLTSILSGSITNTNIIYVAPILDVTIIGLAPYSGNVYDASCAGFTVDVANYPTNVIMLQPY